MMSARPAPDTHMLKIREPSGPTPVGSGDALEPIVDTALSALRTSRYYAQLRERIEAETLEPRR